MFDSFGALTSVLRKSRRFDGRTYFFLRDVEEVFVQVGAEVSGVGVALHQVVDVCLSRKMLNNLRE